MSTVVGGLDRIEAVFDDGSLVGDAGLVLAGTLVGRGLGGADRRGGAPAGGWARVGREGAHGCVLDAGGRVVLF
ncbi:hypothetical protein [Candidatus Poriferisodalis sp.]|uniref:hypothetical protein n=1 Tax=Candidatus Poriferisodalis sp. TaxID=3101277 RepID=UPI003B01F250